ncbi:MAG: RES family NAD+ phosphorylase [Vicinamibacteraceae bacterium]|nr:RES family NAD+ phosphorylase [Vicinamibacteraceae bacterium]
MATPPVRHIDQPDTHRLVPSKYLPRGDSVLTLIADDDEHLAAIFELDDATNERLAGERGLLPGIGPDELLSRVPHARVVNAAFTHAHPLGSRFNGPDRGAWYAGFALETSQAEVAFHKSVELAEIGWPDESVTYDDYLADFRADFHDLRGARGFKACLDPASYVASQALAADLLEAGSLGLVYPSVRHEGGTCLACFRPALVTNLRRGATWRFTWRGGKGPQIEEERPRGRSGRR